MCQSPGALCQLMRSDWVIMALFSYGLQGNIYGYGLNPGAVALLLVRCIPCIHITALLTGEQVMEALIKRGYKTRQIVEWFERI